MERRIFTRVPFSIDSIIRFNDRPILGIVLNISLQGMFIDITESLPHHALVGVEIVLDSSGAHKTLLLPGQVIRSGSGGTAVRLMKLDLDSYIIIRNLMMDVSGNPEVIMDEFCRFIAENPGCRL
jgi:hypothetical protein